MDQIKIGIFLKELRKEKKLTQEQLAEKLNVSGRTVSRWETGSNMPDIGMLVEMADFFDVSIPEIVSGERKSENMNKKTRDTAVAMAEYGRNAVKIGKQKAIGILMSAYSSLCRRCQYFQVTAVGEAFTRFWEVFFWLPAYISLSGRWWLNEACAY